MQHRSGSLQIVRNALSAILLIACAAQVQGAWASNPPIAGNGCADASSSEELGTAPDELSARSIVPIGVESSTPMLHLLAANTRSTTVEEFLSPPPGQTPGQTSQLYVLLVGKHLSSSNRKDMAAIHYAKAMGVPIVLEGWERSEFKTLTGLGLKSEAAMVAFAPGGRLQTISLIHPPKGGHTLASALDAVNRAINKHLQALANPAYTASRQFYAEDVWIVWLHTGNVVCTLPYYAPEDSSYPQVGNLDFGVQISLVAQTVPLEKVVDLKYVGAGFDALPAGVLPIDNNYYFKGAYTLQASLEANLLARFGAALNNTTPVQPQTVAGAHTVTQTNGFTWGFRSTCGGTSTGPNCSITGDFSFSSQTQNSMTVQERTINAKNSFLQISDPNGTHCDDIKNGCWQATQIIHYVLSSTSDSSGGGYSINITGTNNDWNNFFDDSDWTTGIESTKYGDALQYFCDSCGPSSPPQPPGGNTVRNWPAWSSSEQPIIGEASYIFSDAYTGELTLDATASGEEGIFAVGTGPKDARLPNGYQFGCVLTELCGNFADYALDLYTNTATTSATIGIDANQVNYSGMPTCNMLNFTQQDLGIYEILWASDGTKPLSVAKMSPSPFTTTVPTVAKYYAGSGQWVVGVSQTIIEPGQYEYVALCSSTPSTTPAMQLLFSDGGHVSGALTFDGSGQPVNIPANVAYDAASRVFTIR
jgi:hypothetical protein